MLIQLKESLRAVLPLVGIVLLLCFYLAPIPSSILMAFIISSILLIIGMMFFTLGTEMGIVPMGERIGQAIVQNRKLILAVIIFFLCCFLITIAEPDLLVLAEQTPEIPNWIVMTSIGIGVGIFLVVAVFRIFFGIALYKMLVFFYPFVFFMSLLVPKEFVAIAFDSCGITTGPMTVPFIMALGVGISTVRSDRHAATDTFGLVALSSLGPIFATLVLGLFYRPTGDSYTSPVLPMAYDSIEMWQFFMDGIAYYMKSIFIALLPLLIFSAVNQITSFHFSKKVLFKIIIGLGYTYIGLVLFMTGVNIGFWPIGKYIGGVVSSLPYRWIIIPVGMLIGYFIVKAEPSIYILKAQVEELTSGAISGDALVRSICIGVSISIGLSMLRALTDISIYWFLVPGYFIAIILALFTPKIFTAIAFDSGGVASGPMTTTFILPLSMGVCDSLGGNTVADSYGVVTMVVMIPLITIQVMGLIYQRRNKVAAKNIIVKDKTLATLEEYEDYEIIEL